MTVAKSNKKTTEQQHLHESGAIYIDNDSQNGKNNNSNNSVHTMVSN